MKSSSVNCFGAKIKIKHKNLEKQENGLMGRFIAHKKLIEIDKNQSESDYLHTLLHELVHAICWRVGLNQTIDGVSEEILAESVATFLVENFDFKL